MGGMCILVIEVVGRVVVEIVLWMVVVFVMLIVMRCG